MVYIEQIATPKHYAYSKFGLTEHATLQTIPSGTGTMIEAFKEGRIDVGIGLTEAWVAGLAKAGAVNPASGIKQKPYHILSAYTLSPLRWALSTGAKREDISAIESLKGKKVGISRYGRYVVHNSIIASFVLFKISSVARTSWLSSLQIKEAGCQSQKNHHSSLSYAVLSQVFARP